MTRPSLPVPSFATDPLFTGGPEVGLAPRLAPSAGFLKQGFYGEQRVPARVQNYIEGLASDWLKYLQVGYDTMQVMNWAERSAITSTGTVNSVCPITWGAGMGSGGGNLYVVADNTGHTFSSPDANAWSAGSQAIVSGAPSVLAFGIVSGSATFVMGDSASASIWTSLDGGVSAWTSHATGAGSTTSAICYAAGSALASPWVRAGFGEISSSANGITYTARAVPASWTGANNKHITNIIWTGALFIASTSDSHNEVLTSPDGITWTVNTIATDTWHWLGYDPASNVVLLAGATFMARSPNGGVTWTLGFTTGAFAGYGVAIYKGIWVAPTLFGQFGGIAWSPDSTNWTPAQVGNHAGTPQGYRNIIAADQRFTAVRCTGTTLEFVSSLRLS